MAPKPSILEISNDIQDEADWIVGHLREFDLPLQISAFALEPTTRLLAIGTSDGFVFIQGGPAVEVKIRTPSSTALKFLSFAPLSQMLLAIDEEHTLHIWDLGTTGEPEYLKSVRFDPVTSFHVSPSLSHTFVGLATGEIRTYDLACLRKSEYTVPNMWNLYQQSTKGSGSLPGAPLIRMGDQPCLDVQLHPRDLNRIFVAYPGGVILSDLTERRTVRAYEFPSPTSSAKGGIGSGVNRPEATCFAVHPSGHFLAVGHADGSIAFWAVEDDSEPLIVRTLDDEDVCSARGEGSEHVEVHKSVDGMISNVLREPIFKLGWSSFSPSTDPRGGPTTLTVLGGLDSRKGGHVTVLLLPAFQPSNPPGDSAQTGEPQVLHPFFRAAMQESLKPTKISTFEAKGEIQDFLLCPQEHLHLAGSYDPRAILCLQSTPYDSRVVQAYRFPPPDWTVPLGFPGDGQRNSDETQPIPLELPFPFTHGPASINSAHLMTVDRPVYEALTSSGTAASSQRFDLTGGIAVPEETSAGETRSTKYQPHRLLITQDDHGRFRFFDFSAQLLSSNPPAPLEHYFPQPLTALTLDLARSLPFLREPEGDFPNIVTFSFAPEALELAVALQDGGVIICRPSTTDLDLPEDTSILMLNPSMGESTATLMPSFLVQSNSRVQACAMSNIGFLAISYVNGEVIVVDIRGPRILERIPAKTKHGRGGSISHRLSTEPDIAVALAWTISTTESDPTAQVRLLISRRSGTLDISTLTLSGPSGTWAVATTVSAKGAADPIPGGLFVMESKTGDSRGSQRDLFARVVRSNDSVSTPSIFVAVGAAGARSYSNIDGERIGKAEWSTKHGVAVTTQVVERLASKALVVATDKRMALTYTLPSLELISAFEILPFQPRLFTIDQSGDWLALHIKRQGPLIDTITYGTFFDVRRARSLPHVVLAMKKCTTAQPQPVSMAPASILGSWINYYQTMSGKQVDDLLGGPNRPIVVRAAPAKKAEEENTAQGATSNLASSVSQAQSTLYNRLTAAMNERGQMLNDLEERFKSLETGSQNMVNQAKKLAAQQTAKSWFGF